MVDTGEKRGQDGRRFVATERRRELLARFRESGLTRQAFARQEGIRYTTFCAWVQRAESASGRPAPAAKAAMRFTEVTLPASAARGLEVRLADGTSLRGERVADGRGSETGRGVLLHEPRAHAAEALVLGRHGSVGPGEASGTRPLLVAGAERGEVQTSADDARGAGAARRRRGPPARFAEA